MKEEHAADAVALATGLTVAWLVNPNTRTSMNDVPAFLSSIHQAVRELSAVKGEEAKPAPGPDYVPAVSARKSLASPDVIVSMIDGKPYRTLKRHLKGHGLTPDQYRERYRLKADYPMVAPNYSAMRREAAKRVGLGRKPVEATVEMAKTAARKTRRTGAAALKAAKAALGTE